MYKLIKSVLFFTLLSSPVFADWLEEVNDIHTEIQALTVNQQGIGDAQRLERYFDLSYDLAILERPWFATGLGDPRGQDRLSDLSEEGILRRRNSDRAPAR